MSCESHTTRDLWAHFPPPVSGGRAGACLHLVSPARSNDAAGCSVPYRTGIRPGIRSTAASTQTSRPGLVGTTGEHNHLPPPSQAQRSPRAHHVAAPPCVRPLLGHRNTEVHLHGWSGDLRAALGTRPGAPARSAVLSLTRVVAALEPLCGAGPCAPTRGFWLSASGRGPAAPPSRPRPPTPPIHRSLLTCTGGQVPGCAQDKTERETLGSARAFIRPGVRPGIWTFRGP
jgi:hypothetical protein